MGPIGIPEFLTVGIFGLGFYGVWKFFQILSRINDNIAGIRHAVERAATITEPRQFTEPRP